MCKKCRNANGREWVKRNPEKHREIQRRYRERNRLKCRGYYLRNRQRILARSKAWRERNKQWVLVHDRARHWADRERNAAQQRARVTNVRLMVMMHYSPDLRCQRCGFSDIRALSIDHVKGGGTRLRRVQGTGSNLARWLMKNNYPAGYQVLCMNCQFVKRYERGEIRGPLAPDPHVSTSDRGAQLQERDLTPDMSEYNQPPRY